MKLFLDSNIFLRLLIPENKTIHSECEALFNLVSTGTIIPYFSNIVILEVVYTLLRTYKFPRSQVCEWLNDVRKLRNATIIDKTNSAIAVGYYTKLNIKFGDSFIATQIPKNVILCTYDSDFAKIPELKVMSPAEVIKSLGAQIEEV